MSDSKREHPHKRKNKHALLTQTSVKVVQDAVNKIAQQTLPTLTEREQAIWKLIQDVITESMQIDSCDLPSDNADNEALVRLTHQASDFIMGNSTQHPVKDFHPDTSSMLEKIAKISEIAFKIYRAGNCQEKAFFGFIRLLKKLIESGLSTSEQAITLELAYFNNHFIFIVDNRFLVDPWLSTAFPFRHFDDVMQVFSGAGQLHPFFVIDKQWNCYLQRSDNVDATLAFLEDPKDFFDRESTLYTFTFFGADPKVFSEFVFSVPSDTPVILQKYRKIFELKSDMDTKQDSPEQTSLASSPHRLMSPLRYAESDSSPSSSSDEDKETKDYKPIRHHRLRHYRNR